MANISFLGQVYKVHSNVYFVKDKNGTLNKCGARGILKLKKDKISVGDFVSVSNGAIDKVFERKNYFIRPNVSNVDLIVAVISPEPKPDFYLLDKLMINAEKEKVELIIAVNKTDVDDTLIDYVKTEYGNLGVKIISISSKTGDGIKELKEYLFGKLTVLAGQSAVGKTSIVNAMFNLDLKTGDLSDKILRGKHTTTRSEIFEYDNVRLIDSPGFAVIDACVSANDLCECYPEYVLNSEKCKFRGCKHVSEPDCEIKQLVTKGLLSKERYERYLEIYTELSKRRIIYEKD